MIHSTAIIGDGARIGTGVEIGAYTVVGENVTVGDNCRIGPHCTVTGHTEIGAGTRIHSGAVIGDEPQDYHYKGDRSYTIIGKDCIIREYVTIHRGAQAESVTQIGDNVMLMGFVHIAHNCRLGNRVVIANSTLLAGHVEVEDAAFISARVMIHQFARIGSLAMIGGGAMVNRDVPPFCMLPRVLIMGPNTIGLRRAGMSGETRKQVRRAIKLFYFNDLNRANALLAIRSEMPDVPEVKYFADFIEQSKRGVMAGARDGGGAAEEAGEESAE